MPMKPIYVTDYDKTRLLQLLESYPNVTPKTGEYRQRLSEELRRAISVKPEEIGQDVVTMHSTVVIRDLDSGETLVLTLVFPSEADLADWRISILAPLGTALIGYRVGDTVEWQVPAGVRRFQVERVLHQPEAAFAPGH